MTAVAAEPRTLSARAFTRLHRTGLARAERELPALERAYERIIRRAGRDAAANLRAVTAAADWQPPPEGTLLALRLLSEIAAGKLRPIHLRVLRAILTPPLARVGIAWDVHHPASAALLENAARRVGISLGDAVSPVLREIIASSFGQGLSVLDTAAQIEAKIDDVAPWQARMLARTDLNGLANGGSVAAAKQVGVTHKRWLTAHDARVRPAHVAASGQTVPVDQPFHVCGESLQYPGDPAGSDACCANCRCTVTYPDKPLTAGGAMANTAANEAAEAMLHLVAAGAETAAVTITVGDNADAAAPVAWVSDLAFEGAATEDGRYILPGALEWRELPLTLMALTETGPGGHEGAFVAGRIDEIGKDESGDMEGDPLPDGVTAVRATGVFDTGGDNGSEVARLVGEATVRGVSVDLAILAWGLRDPENGEILDPDTLDETQMERAMAGDLQYAVKSASIMAATVCPTPAFADARIAITADSQTILSIWAPLELAAPPPLTAAVGVAPLRPPRDWFYTREPNGPTPLTVTDDGHVYGHLAVWDSCHTGRPGECFVPPRSPSGYAYFNLGEVECDDDTRVAVGQITMDTFHAPLSATGRAARAHYEHTGVAAADVRASDGAYGIWITGALRPSVSAEQARALMAAKPSGDWRQMTPGGPLELLGALQVNSPGFPVPRTEARLVASSDHPEGEVVALIGGGVEVDDETFLRRVNVLAARAEGIDGLAALAEEGT